MYTRLGFSVRVSRVHSLCLSRNKLQYFALFSDEPYFGDDSQAAEKASYLLQQMLDCLYKCFLHDRGGFVTKERFDCLMQPLTDQVCRNAFVITLKMGMHKIPSNCGHTANRGRPRFLVCPWLTQIAYKSI